MNQPESIKDKITECTTILEFMQEALNEDRKKLSFAKKQKLPLEIIEMIQTSIENLEKSVDRYQSRIAILKNQPIDET